MLHDFELPQLGGGSVTLSRWRGQELLLIFVSPRCRPTRTLLSGLRGVDPRPGPPLISTGDVEENRRLVAAYDVRAPVLLQEQSEVARAYHVGGTPMSYLVDQRGVTASALTVGADALLALAAGKPGAVTRDRRAPIPFTPFMASEPIERGGPRVGAPAPDFRAALVSGGETSLADYRERSWQGVRAAYAGEAAGVALGIGSSAVV